jgi:hypothetical protein
MNINNISLKDFLERVKVDLSKDCDFYFEGRGDGTVGAIIQEKKITIINNKKEKNK